MRLKRILESLFLNIINNPRLFSLPMMIIRDNNQIWIYLIPPLLNTSKTNLF